MMDPGQRVLDYTFKQMQTDAEWSTREERRFVWWGHTLAQRVWADDKFLDDGFEIYRVFVATDLVTDFRPTEENLRTVNAFNADASLSAIEQDCRDPSNLSLVASTYVHTQTSSSVESLFLLITAYQAAEAHELAPILAERLGAKINITPHPSSGLRAVRDDMLNIITATKEPSKPPRDWASQGISQALGMFQDPPCVLATGDSMGLSAEFPMCGSTSLLHLRSDSYHARLGYGASIELCLPITFSTSELVKTALQYNNLELQEMNRCHFIGSWTGIESTLKFVCFLPYRYTPPGLIQSIAMSMAIRARWVAEEIMGDNWAESYSTTKPAMFKEYAP